ncbi:hypothetical protein VD0002_g5572 [Verticillium dahliae]|uniref:Uncharacterized protein n=1 Tax=Verticillium dahliae TaxID=27337 RepID=A0AA44WMH8_VERDA|nr:hypothetical protein BJF96_g2568 [Verticillium dahliae]PNH42091.1 hypothetical protein VD0004_g5133 [Verticillium dahliae]PNH50014.1 hypothetical protein VD0003_g7146 [Verticillium dahliae]PNH62507.1 hypothetical protein VD0002_g5572 [Verticillium dahliae]PNH72782.1 hypothetical protein VD0001_g4783 [Verticillium dahliae]
MMGHKLSTCLITAPWSEGMLLIQDCTGTCKYTCR